MTRTHTFSDSFWDNDFCGTQGFETLLKHLKDGKQVCKDVEEFLKARAKAEEEYGKALQRVGKQISPSKTSTMIQACQVLYDETNKIAQDHLDAAKAIYEEAIRLNMFTTQQREKRKQHEDNVRKSIKKKGECHKKTTDSKKKYEQSCREMEQIDSSLAIAYKATAQSGSKETEKLTVKRAKVASDIHRADQQYRDCVDALEDSRQQWEKDMVALCEEFEKLEEERITYLRDELWSHANINSQTCVDVDERYETVRVALAGCDVDGDISAFIRSQSTGRQRPRSVLYEKYGTNSHAPPSYSAPTLRVRLLNQ